MNYVHKLGIVVVGHVYQRSGNDTHTHSQKKHAKYRIVLCARGINKTCLFMDYRYAHVWQRARNTRAAHSQRAYAKMCIRWTAITLLRYDLSFVYLRVCVCYVAGGWVEGGVCVLCHDLFSIIIGFERVASAAQMSGRRHTHTQTREFSMVPIHIYANGVVNLLDMFGWKSIRVHGNGDWPEHH